MLDDGLVKLVYFNGIHGRPQNALKHAQELWGVLALVPMLGTKSETSLGESFDESSGK